jgi:hypothetical protein
MVAVSLAKRSSLNRLDASLSLITIGVACSDTPRVMIPELFPSETLMPAIEAAFKANKADVSKYDSDAQKK